MSSPLFHFPQLSIPVSYVSQVLKVLEGHTSCVYAVAISVDGSKIVSGSRDNTVRVWSMETGEVRLPVLFDWLCSM